MHEKWVYGQLLFRFVTVRVDEGSGVRHAEPSPNGFSMLLLLSCLVHPGLIQATSPPEEAIPEPVWEGDPEGAGRLGPWIEGSTRSTRAFGSWPEGSWGVLLHRSDADFETVTKSPPGRFAIWIGSTLHLRPWVKLQRRDLGALLRHELTHRRLADQGLPRWKEEALCLWAEGHTHPPKPSRPEPDETLTRRLDAVLAGGTTASQAWAYAWLRAWNEGTPAPAPPLAPASKPDIWQEEAPLEKARITVAWPPERLPRAMQINGRNYTWRHNAHHRFTGQVCFGPGLPVSQLAGEVVLDASPEGWRMTWTLEPDTWIAAATDGELGGDAPFEAKRALAAVLRKWLQGHPHGHHPDGTLCPLTHCAVIRGEPSQETRRAVLNAPELNIDPALALFTGSKGGVSWSPREAWGDGPETAGQAQVVSGDPWASWTRQLSAAQVRVLKTSVKPGLKPGQRGLNLGPSGPFAVETLRLETGRHFGWTLWPSNACEAQLEPDGSLALKGHGWGHNVGLCLATALDRARNGDRAEEILQEAFGAWR